MARTDDRPIPCLLPDYKPAHQSELQDWLMKEAEGGIKPEDNENTPRKGATDLYDDPPDRKDVSNIDGQWGEGSKAEPFHQNDATYEQSKKDRHDVTSRAFDKLTVNEKADQAMVSELFEHGRSGQFTTHSVPLLTKTKEGAAEPQLSLSERVRKFLHG